MGKTRTLGVLGLVTLAAAATACGSGTVASRSAPPQSPRAAVLASMGQIQTASYRFTMQLSMTGFGSAMAGADATAYTFSETGAFSGSQRALDATLTSPLLKSASLGSGIRVVAFYRTGTFYVSLGAGAGAGAGAGKWYEITGNSAGLGALLGSLGDDSPFGYIGTVNGAVVSSAKVGTATVDGVTATEYAVTENLRAILDKVLSGGLADQIAKSFGGGSTVGGQAYSESLTAALKALPPDLTIDAYVDAGGHLRRLALSIPLGPMFTAVFSSLVGPSGAGGTAGLPSGELSTLDTVFAHVQENVTMDLSDYGAAIVVSAPPASEVVKGNPLVAGASASASASQSASASSANG